MVVNFKVIKSSDLSTCWNPLRFFGNCHKCSVIRNVLIRIRAEECRKEGYEQGLTISEDVAKAARRLKCNPQFPKGLLKASIKLTELQKLNRNLNKKFARAKEKLNELLGK